MRCLIGVDLGGTNVRVAFGDSTGKIISRLAEKSDKNSGPMGIARQITRMISSLKLAGKFHSVVLGCAGPLDLEDGSVVHSPHLGYDRIPVVKPLCEALQVPVHLMNDCVAAAVGEKEIGDRSRCSNLVYVTISSGIGAGVFVDDNLLIGKDGNAHEVGHMTLDYSAQLRCGCGKKGHWEAYCGGANASRFIDLQLSSRNRTEFESSLLYELCGGETGKLSSKDLFESARKCDSLSLEIVEEMGRLNAIGFANITNAYDPELIIVGGAIPLAHSDLVLEPIKRLIGQYCLNRTPDIRLTELGEDAVLRGTLVFLDSTYCKALSQGRKSRKHAPK